MGDAAQPGPLRPMLAVPGELPASGEDGAWAYEMKWDGVRALAHVVGGRVRLTSRNDLDVTLGYPEVAAAPPGLRGVDAVLDGELVTLDELGRPSFGRLQERMHVRDPTAVGRLADRVPVVYLVFDLLRIEGEDLLRTPYAGRRARLAGLDIDAASWRVPPSFRGPGADVLAASAENGLEGVVAKRSASLYLPGRRSPDWRKVKHLRMQAVVIAGWRPGRGRRAGRPGSFVLGVHGPSGLRHAGGVGTGFTERMLDDLAARLAPLARASSPFAHELPRGETRDVHWVEPRLVGEVVFAEWTADGRLRHPSWRGLRPDTAPGDVRREA